MSKRFFKVARKFFESDEWTTPRVFSEAEVWLDMIFLACYAEHDIDLGKEGILTLQRGEFYYTQRQLAKRWGWPLSKVNRHLARLAEGDNPRIEKIQRETQNETHFETQVETQITVIRLCNYDSYNRADSKSETHFETHFETQNETLNKKGYNKKGDKNTHTHYRELKDLFASACMRVYEDASACEQASKTCEEMLLYIGEDNEARSEHQQVMKNDKLYNVMFSLYHYYSSLQRSFPKPLHPHQMRDLLQRNDISDIWRVIEAIDNKRESVKTSSLYKTIKHWLNTDLVLIQRRREQQQIYN